jgi:hypothetical protein
MPLFVDAVTLDPSPARHNESHYAFLARAEGEPWSRIRNELDRWVDEVADPARTDLVARLRSDDVQHRSAWWELYLHAALVRAGYTLTPHPTIVGSTRHPDYLVSGSGSHSFYLEATITGHVPANMAARSRVNAIYDLLNELDSPNFFLNLDLEAVGPNPPGTRGMRHDLKTWLDSLDPDADLSKQSAEWVWTNPDGWRVRFSVIPKHRLRGQPGVRPLGVYDHGGARIVAHRDVLLGALLNKASGSPYGSLDLPYVIAVMDDDEVPPDASFIADALYGRIASVLDVATGQLVEESERAPDGFWRDRSGLRHESVSAVITAWSISPWDVAGRSPRVWHNPHAARPLTAALPFPAVRYRPDTNEFAEEPAGAPPLELFGLPAGWPGFPSRAWESVEAGEESETVGETKEV